MDRETQLAIVRSAYAKQILAAANIDNAALEAAFATVRREDYLGPGPWPILRPSGYVATPSADPVYLYADVLIGIIPERGLNNGQPSAHAAFMASADPKQGEHVVHVGAGAGYYTAILSQLVGPSGRVTAIECDPALAARTAAKFSAAPNVHIVEGDGTAVVFDAADVIFVNAGATRPADAWLDGLADGGRLILPLTAKKRLPPGGTIPLSRHGAVFRIERKGNDYFARWISPVGIYPCEGGGRDDESEALIDGALQRGGWENVRRLYRVGDLPDERCWLRAAGWSLAYD